MQASQDWMDDADFTPSTTVGVDVQDVLGPPAYDDDKLIYSSEEKMMISITGNTESVFSNKLRIEVNSKHEDKKAYTPYTPMTGGNPPPPQSKASCAPASGNHTFGASGS